MKNSYISNYAVGYIPETFLLAVGVDTFSNASSNITNKISYAWLVRSFRLFEGVSDWMRINNYGDFSTTKLMNTWARSSEIHNLSFSASTGRLQDASGLNFVKHINPKITDAKVKALYVAVSKVLKKWDLWYLNNWVNWVQSVAHELTGFTRSEAKAFLVDANYYYFTSGVNGKDLEIANSNNKKLLSNPVTIDDVVCYEITTLKSNERSFEAERIDTKPSTETPYEQNFDSSIKDNVTVLTGKIGMDMVLKADAIREAGGQVIIKRRGIGAVEQMMDKAELSEEDKASTIISNTDTRFPVLDFIGRSNQESQTDDSESN